MEVLGNHIVSGLFQNAGADAGKKVAVFQKNSQLPSILNAGVGSIINSFRTALDLLATALARRNGVVHNRNIYFPIFRNESDFAEFLKKKEWLSQTESTILERLRPYDGGNSLLWSLHQLDIIRKHRRLLLIDVPTVKIILIGIGKRPRFLVEDDQNLENNTPLFEISADTTLPEVGIDFNLIFREQCLPAVDGRPIFEVLADFRHTVTQTVDLFNV